MTEAKPVQAGESDQDAVPAHEADAAHPVTTRGARRGRPAATIYDIAKLAGVNPSTVSRALSKPGRINVKTEERIHAAAKELNYRLNPMARALPTGRTSSLGLLLADITNPMFFNVVRGAESAASMRGYTLLLAESQESAEREAAAAERLSPSVDGLVLVTSRLSDEQIIELADQHPLVVINRKVDSVPGIVPDIVPGIEQALAHLGGLGHTSIGFVSGPANSWMNRARWETLLGRAPSLGMTIVEIGPGKPTLAGGADTLARVVASGVTAVLAYNDLMAIGLMRAAQESGLEVPGELSIIGFDDIFGSDFTSPQLSTVRTPLGAIGDRAVRLMMQLLDEDAGVPARLAEETPLVTELVVRGSTGPAAR
ncbi:LacI family DNA-binding transcriptional regulator [Cryobacterium sp. AP23]